jgi:hypothetical protein
MIFTTPSKDGNHGSSEGMVCIFAHLACAAVEGGFLSVVRLFSRLL